ncbi:Rhs-family protein, partial [Olavius sp. associated proteobacterium Delta 1]
KLKTALLHKVTGWKVPPKKRPFRGSKRLIRIESTYYYDPFGRRLWKEINGIRTYFVYADEGLVA